MEKDEMDSEEKQQGEGQGEVYLPGMPMESDEKLVRDESAYITYHQAQTGAPCLSFDVLKDQLGDNREDFPLTCYLVCGTQADRSHTNNVIVMKMSNIHTTQKDNNDDDDEDEEDEEDDDEKPVLDAALIRHDGTINRIRSTIIEDRHIAATWSETGKVHIWDLSRPMQALEDAVVMGEYTRNQESPSALYTFSGHMVEGYAMDWSPTTPGMLATGDCNKNIHVWKPQAGGFSVDQRPFSSHTASVEDIQWSPNEPTVFASCSVDHSIKVWDIRAKPSAACMLTSADAHTRDINVISWNRSEPFIVSGGDDSLIKIWDLRKFKSGESVATLAHHKGAISSVEWHPTDSSVLAACGEDDQLTQWDLAVEKQADEHLDVPQQLLFIHQGQKELKELHWHPQIPGLMLSTALSGFNVFKTISV